MAFMASTTSAFLRTLEDISQRSPVLAEFLGLPGPSIRIHVPFSGAFDEAHSVRDFLTARMPATWQSVFVEASDIHLPQTMGFRDIQDPRLRFSSRIIDLSREDMPDCDLALGLHPQVVGYEGNGWERIIQQVVHHSRAAIFTTWLKIEHDRLAAMLKQNGCDVQSWQNSHAVSEMAGYDESSKRFHFVVIARKVGQGSSLPMQPQPTPPLGQAQALPRPMPVPLHTSTPDSQPRPSFAGLWSSATPITTTTTAVASPSLATVTPLSFSTSMIGTNTYQPLLSSSRLKTPLHSSMQYLSEEWRERPSEPISSTTWPGIGSQVASSTSTTRLYPAESYSPYSYSSPHWGSLMPHPTGSMDQCRVPTSVDLYLPVTTTKYNEHSSLGRIHPSTYTRSSEYGGIVTGLGGHSYSSAYLGRSLQ